VASFRSRLGLDKVHQDARQGTLVSLFDGLLTGVLEAGPCAVEVVDILEPLPGRRRDPTDDAPTGTGLSRSVNAE